MSNSSFRSLVNIIETTVQTRMMNSLTAAARSLRSSHLPLATRSLTTTVPRFNAAAESEAERESETTAGEQKIREILSAKFKPSVLKVQDVSGK